MRPYLLRRKRGKAGKVLAVPYSSGGFKMETPTGQLLTAGTLRTPALPKVRFVTSGPLMYQFHSYKLIQSPPK